ncbi:hypothetical protein C7B79_25740, partial [Chroococcidiopsis cubana CCALA 043]|uniref:two-partner secretion domain-containing protein n=1 Tax=Chroococcidiopsis cubana TaxID=171392 RepID=UPI000D0625D5
MLQILPEIVVGQGLYLITTSISLPTGGTTRETNLFHSFDRFSVPTNGTAFFNNPAEIQNIFSRVTGGSISNIDGLIRANGTANLFLLNPNGIIFGQNASLNIGGSFIATTARSINFADGTQFSATPGTGTPLLTISVPLGLQFGTGAGEIVNRSNVADSSNFVVGLQVQSGKTLGLIGGNINLEGGSLTAAGGRIELGAVATPGIIGISADNNNILRFSFPTDLALADVSLNNIALVDVSAGDSGSIAVNARNLNVFSGSQLTAGIGENQGRDGAVAGDIDINVQDAIAIDGQNQQGSASGFFNSVAPGGTGNSGNINVRARALFLTNRARLRATTEGQGNAGDIEVQAQDSVSLDNSFLTSNLGSRQGTTPTIGNVGNIRIDARKIAFTNGAELQAGFLPNARQQGNPGVVSLEATDSISFAGRSSSDPDDGSGIFTDVEPGAVANGSNIQISAPLVSFDDIAVLEASNSGQGNGGDIELQGSKSVRLRNGSQISTSAGGTGQRGDAGNITITSPLVIAEFQGNNDIFANAFDGEGGEIKINAQSIIGLRPRTSQELQPELQRLFGTATPTTEQLQAFLGELADNDVAAISLNNPSLSGTVSFNAADIDPSHNIVELPAGLVDASGLVAAGCPSGAENRFVVAGRGGLPPAPGDRLSSDALLTDWATLQTPETQNRATAEKPFPQAANIALRIYIRTLFESSIDTITKTIKFI